MSTHARTHVHARTHTCPHAHTHTHTHTLPYSADSVQREVTEAEIEQFQNTTKLITLPITNINSPRLADRRTPDGRAGVMVRVCPDVMVRVYPDVCNGEGVMVRV